MIYDANIGERCETIRTWFERWLNKKPCYPHGQQSLKKVKFATYY